MTIEELDRALETTGLDLSNPPDKEARDKVLRLHGLDLIQSKKSRCSRCWFKENRGECQRGCDLENLPEDPVEASLAYLSHPNEIQVFPFLWMYMIPVYKELTGRTNVVEDIRREFKRRWKKEHPDELGTDVSG